jgi:ParB-like chromosome segregation protein Spo0J
MSADEVKLVPVASLQPTPENNDVYGALSIDDPQVIDLVQSIRRHGLLEPIQVSVDGYVISGHRRLFACRIAKLELVRVLVRPVSYRATAMSICDFWSRLTLSASSLLPSNSKKR